MRDSTLKNEKKLWQKIFRFSCDFGNHQPLLRINSGKDKWWLNYGQYQDVGIF
jgi:hypothetical protein